MKSQLLSVSAAVSLGVLSTQGMAADKTLNDLFIEKDKHIYVIAERPDESLVKINCTGGVLFFGDSMDKEAMVEYCASVGGTASLSEPPREDSFKTTFISRHANVTCKAPNNKGFTASFFHPKYSSDDYTDAWLHVKYDAPQPTGYYMKAYYKEWVAGKYSTAKDFGIGNRDNYYSGTFLKGPALCTAKGGKYMMATEETQGYAIDLNDYLFAIANKIGAFENEFADGQHWCVDTKDPADEFTVTSYKGRFYREFKASMGVNRADIKIFNGKGLPPYYMKNSDRTEDGAADNAPVSDSVKMSRTSTPAIASLAAKTIASKTTVLERQGGAVLEGIYLGQNDKGCMLSAIMSSADQPYGQKSVMNDSANGWIMNYKQCGNAPVEYLGESFEKKFPAAIGQEYNRVLGMCRIKGMGMGSYLGYNIDCMREGSMAQPVYEMVITKKDKLVVRKYENQ